MHRLTLVLFVLFPNLALAQTTTRTIPAEQEKAEGNSSTDVYSSGWLGRVQQIVSAGAVASGVARISELRLRSEHWVFPTTPASIPQTKLSLGMTRVSVGGMTNHFAKNRQGPQTLVYSGSYQMPAPTYAYPRPFSYTWKFAQPFVYQPAVGNLMIEWEWGGWTGLVQDRFDLQIAGSGSAQQVGQFGKFSSPGAPWLTVNTTVLKPGGNVDMRAQGLAQPYPAVACFGFSDKSWGPIRLPLSLTPLGAPNEVLWNSVDWIVPCVSSGGAGNAQATVQFPIPGGPQLGNLRFHGQLLFVDPPANAFGIVAGPSSTLQLAKAGLFGSVWAKSLTAPTGWLLRDGGLVFQLAGQLP